jgi:NitT/TauT family transport system substrate-binding protein
VGLALYSSSIVASEATIKNDPNLVRSFVRATERGLREAFADPGSAGKIMNKYNHQIEPAMASQAMVLLRDMVMTPLGKEKGLGYIDPKRMKDTVAIVAEASPRMGPVDYHDVFAAGFAAPLPQ